MKSLKLNKLSTLLSSVQGGCGIVAGWGARFDYQKSGEVCSTAPNTFFPGRAKVCENSWSLEGRNVHECALKKPLPTDFETSCRVSILHIIHL